MKWGKVSVSVKKEEAEVVASLFDDIDAGGVEIDDPTLTAEDCNIVEWAVPLAPREQSAEPRVTITSYLAVDASLKDRVVRLGALLGEYAERTGASYGAEDVKLDIVDDADWVDNWKQYFHTTKVGKRTVIQPAWESYEPKAGELVVTVDPSAAFGTGTHPTTALCIRALEELVTPGMRVFDVGTGSGILAILAAKLGAGEVVAMDYDPAAAQSAAENVVRNGVESLVKTGQSDLLQAFEGKADLVIANIIADIVIRLFDTLEDSLAPGGRLLASGIIGERAEDVKKAGAAKGFHFLREFQESGWTSLLFAREGE